MSISFDIILEDGSVSEYRGVACLAALARVRSHHRYSLENAPVKSVRLFFYNLYGDWHEYLMGSPAIMPYIQSYGRTDCGHYYYEVSAKVNPHHLMFILGTIRMPFYLRTSYNLWKELKNRGVHPDVAFYFSTFLYSLDGFVYSYGDGDEYSIQLERYASWEGLRKFLTGVAVNKNIPSYYTKKNVMYSSYKTYSRDGQYPVQGWLNGYVKTASNSVYRNRYVKKGTGILCTLEELASVLIQVQNGLENEGLELRSVSF